MIRTPFVSLRFDLGRGKRVARACDLVAAVEAQAAAGELPAGVRIPPVRVIGHQLGLSKNTVQAAMDELVARGVLENRPRQGLFAAAALPRPATPARAHEPAAPRLMKMPLTPAGAAPTDPKTIPLSAVFIDPELLPRSRMEACLRAVLKRGMPAFYDPRGFPPLREAIAARLRRLGMEAHADHILTTNGSQQALDVVSRALAVKSLATESPAYLVGKQLFAANGLTVTGLPLDPFRPVDLDLWERTLAKARPSLLYLISRFQNPTGHSYTTAELRRLLALSRKYGFGLFEDDWGSDMLSYTDFRPSLRALGGRRVLYANSFTKKVLPSLRLGYLLADEDSMPALQASKRVASLGSPTLIEAALFEFLDRGYYDRHLRQVQPELDRRYRLCLAALSALMPEGVRWTTPGGGPVLWLEVPRRVDLPKLRERLLGRGVSMELSHGAFTGPRHLNGFRVGYAFLPPSRLRRALEILAEELRR